MKNLLYNKKTGMSFLALLFICLCACKGSDDEVIISNESSAFEQKIDISLLSDEQIAILSDKYAVLFEGLYNDLLRENVRISISESNISSEDYLTRRATDYINRLTSQENALFSYMLFTQSEITREGSVFIKFIESKKHLIFNENDNKLVDEIDAFYDGANFKSLDLASRKEIKLRLESLKKIRFIIIRGVNKYILNETFSTRMSPGDRMIWSQAVSIMDANQLNGIIGMSLWSLGWGTAGSVGKAVQIASFMQIIWSIFG